MNRPLLICIFLLMRYVAIAQDPLNEIDPSRRTQGTNTERPSTSTTEIPGTIRSTTDDRTVRTLDEENSPEAGTVETPRDTATIKFVDENGRVISNPLEYVHPNREDPNAQRKAADTLDYFRRPNPALPDTTFYKP
jgi:hypothetical protein